MHFVGRIENGEFAERSGSFITAPELVAKLAQQGYEKHVQEGILDAGYLKKLQSGEGRSFLQTVGGVFNFVLDVTVRRIPGLGRDQGSEEDESGGK
jgi:hypothetical protein